MAAVHAYSPEAIQTCKAVGQEVVTSCLWAQEDAQQAGNCSCGGSQQQLGRQAAETPHLGTRWLRAAGCV